MAITIRPTIPGGSGATFGSDATITVDGAYNGGTLADGSRYIVAPAGVKVLSSSPAPTTVSGRYMNGISDGSFYSTEATQALDQGPSGAGNDVDGFDMARSLDLARVYRPGESIIKAKSRTGATTSDDVRLPEVSLIQTRKPKVSMPTAKNVSVAGDAKGGDRVATIVAPVQSVPGTAPCVIASSMLA